MAHSQLNEQTVMNIHARTKLIDSSWSLISNAAIQIGNDIFEVSNVESSHYFNGVKNVAFPIVLSNKYNVTMHEQMLSNKDEQGQEVLNKEVSYTIDLAGKGSITISNYLTMLSIRVDSYLHDTYGMLGFRTKDGMIGRDGTTIVAEDEMGSEWQVRDTEPMLFHSVGSVPQYPESCTMPSVTTARQLRQSSLTDDEVKNACANVDDSMKPFCIDDVTRSGDVAVANEYLSGAW
jgi:hypothetical protein